jgi:hypothetical protein
MCVTTAALSMIATGLSTAFGVMGQISQARSQAAAAEQASAYNQQVAANEAATRQQLAEAALAKGAAERDRVIRAALSKQGELRAGMGASGFQLDSGSNLSLLAESAQEGQYDAEVVSNNAAQEAWGHYAGVTAAQNQAAFARYEGEKAGSSSGLGLSIAGTVLGGLGSGLTKWDEYQKSQYPGSVIASQTGGAMDLGNRGYKIVPFSR